MSVADYGLLSQVTGDMDRERAQRTRAAAASLSFPDDGGEESRRRKLVHRDICSEYQAEKERKAGYAKARREVMFAEGSAGEGRNSASKQPRVKPKRDWREEYCK